MKNLLDNPYSLKNNYVVQLSSTLALTTMFYTITKSDVYLGIISIITSYVLTYIYIYIIDTAGLDSCRKLLVVHVLLTSILYKYISMKLLSFLGFTLLKSVIFIVVLVLFFQALSINLDLVSSRIPFTVLDMMHFVLMILIYVDFIYNLQFKAVLIMVILSLLLTIFSTVNKFPFHSIFSPIILYVLNIQEAYLIYVFLCLVHLSYLYGYIETILEPGLVIPYYTTRSLVLMTLLLINSVIFFYAVSMRFIIDVYTIITVFLIIISTVKPIIDQYTKSSRVVNRLCRI